MYRVAGAGSRLRKYTIGPYGRITLPMARAHAQKIFAARLDGRDPAEEKKHARRKLVVDQVEDLIETFIPRSCFSNRHQQANIEPAPPGRRSLLGDKEHP